MCRMTPNDMSYQEIRGGHWKKGRIREVRIKQPFYKMQRINPLSEYNKHYFTVVGLVTL
ncbi:unnamed protein product [Staurois parvus]|uniref:Uncharacterized protein n=1 Tax=Staurois parvus TaxID=386267 RepID=A0ABN9ESN8_9NEOB|nr:unnamed protein product [Staurois parvus]